MSTEMQEVSKKIFFEKIGKLDVNPRPVGNWVEGKGYLTYWETKNRKLIGVTFGGKYEIIAQYN